ncbi:hypothetical protein [Marinobacter sp.]|uniref:hypothetical protein n=1 Tax=Marinobacter sp. TaxID=50741 RepID=UPI0019839F19|nr:hypothetical protein [Marinobacter sp.]MBC7191008.1 hypothetical protein [Marinobacter sp.]
MMDADTQLAYAIFWTAYALAFVVFFLLVSRLLRILPLYGLRTLLQAALIVVLLTPVQSAEVAGWWVPAWLHGGYESILGETAEAARAFFNMGLAAAVMLLVWILDLVRYRFYKK